MKEIAKFGFFTVTEMAAISNMISERLSDVEGEYDITKDYRHKDGIVRIKLSCYINGTLYQKNKSMSLSYDIEGMEKSVGRYGVCKYVASYLANNMRQTLLTIGVI